MAPEPPPIRLLLVEPNPTARAAIRELLDPQQYRVEVCDSLDQVIAQSGGAPNLVALVAWQAMGGLLADEHRNHLLKVTNRIRLIVLVPRRWAPLLEPTDLGKVVAGIVPKPFEPDELATALDAALMQPAGSPD
jgi:CheY-like chemotaxis protein